MADDSFFQPEPGNSVVDHLVSGLVPVAILVVAAIGYPRLRPGVRAVLAVVLGLFGIVAGSVEPVYYGPDEGLSGATVKRPALTRCVKALRPGDTLIVWKLDRLGRNLRDLITLLDALRTQGITFRPLTEHIDTETAAGRAMWQMIGVLAELERSLITERSRAGVKAARQRGVQFGPKPKLTPQQITHARALRAQGEPVRVIAALFKVHRATLYRALAD